MGFSGWPIYSPEKDFDIGLYFRMVVPAGKLIELNTKLNLTS